MTDHEKIVDLQQQVQELAEELARQFYNHRGPVEWDPDQGWLRIVPNRDGVMPPNCREQAETIREREMNEVLDRLKRERETAGTL